MRLGRPSLRYLEQDCPGGRDEAGNCIGGGGGSEGLPWWLASLAMSDQHKDKPRVLAGSTGSEGEGVPPTASCPPGWTPATTPGATPGSCIDGAGHVVSPDAFFLAQTVDSSYSPAQWQAWINLGNYNPATHKFRSERTGPNGEVLDAWVDKPTDCPSGMTAAGASKCFDEGDPRLYGGVSGGAAAAPPPPDDQGKAQLEYTGDPLQDALYQFFNQRAGIFGKRNPYLLGASLRTGTEDLAAKPLGGGGIWWGDARSLSSALAPFTGTPTPPPNPFPVPKSTVAAPVPDVTGGSVTPPKTEASIGPLTSALLTSPSFGPTQKRSRARSPLEQALLGTGI